MRLVLADQHPDQPEKNDEHPETANPLQNNAAPRDRQPGGGCPDECEWGN